MLLRLHEVRDFLDFSRQCSLPMAPAKPFGEGPYPCLNPVADHQGQPTIASAEMSSAMDRRKKIRAVFGCPRCGYTYLRYGPDKTVDDRLPGDTK